MTLPNLITIARFLSVPVIVYLLRHELFVSAFLLFLLSGLSDAVDGIIARHFNQRSELGAWLDPIADKVLLVAVYVTLGLINLLPDWLVILVVSRDLLIVGAVLISALMARLVAIRPILVSKATTAAQIALAVAILAGQAFGWVPALLINSGIGLVAVLTGLSAASYLLVWLRHMAMMQQSG